MKCRTGPEIHHRLLAGRCSFVSFFHKCYIYALLFILFHFFFKSQRTTTGTFRMVRGRWVVSLGRFTALPIFDFARECAEMSRERSRCLLPSFFIRLSVPFGSPSCWFFFFYDSLPYPRPEKKEQKRSSFLISFALTFDIMCLCVCRCVGVWVGVLRFCVTNIDLTFFPSKPPPHFSVKPLTHTHTHKHTHTHTRTRAPTWSSVASFGDGRHETTTTTTTTTEPTNPIGG